MSEETSAQGPAISPTHDPNHSTVIFDSMPANTFRRLTRHPVVDHKRTELVTVLPKMAAQGINTGTTFKGEMIPKESAVCRFCFYRFVENDDGQDVLRTYCKCNYSTLTHYRCAIDWGRKKGDYKCERCNQDTRFLRVAILSTRPTTANSSVAQPAVNQEQKFTGGVSTVFSRRTEGGRMRGRLWR